MAKLVLHPGSPKTGTSTIQEVLRVNRRALKAQGVGLVLPEDLRGTPFLGKYLSAYRSDKAIDLGTGFADFLAPWKARFDTVICSEETFCHDFMPSRRFAHGGIDRAEVSSRLLSANGFEKVEIVLTIRDHVDFLISTYTHFVHRHREKRVFAEWLKEEVDLDRLRWEPVVNAFRSAFGASAVQVLWFDMVKAQGMTGYLEHVLKAFGIDLGMLVLDGDTIQNPSPSQRAVQLCRVMNAEIHNLTRSVRVNNFLMAEFPTSEFGKFRPQWVPTDSNRRAFNEDRSRI